MPAKTTAKCKNCGSVSHYTTFCYQAKRKAISKESRKTHGAKVLTYQTWLRRNPPDSQATWDCYLKISPDCLLRVNARTLNFEHIFPRSKYKELTFCQENIEAACAFCNVLKASRTLFKLAEIYPHIDRLINEPIWVSRIIKLQKLSAHRRKRNSRLTAEPIDTV